MTDPLLKKDLHTPLSFINNVLRFLDECKIEAIVALDLFQKSSIADYMIVASGRSARHLKATADNLKEYFHSCGLINIKMEGIGLCDWVLVDAGDIIVHLFRPEIRPLYNLEKMWGAHFPSLTPSLSLKAV